MDNKRDDRKRRIKEWSYAFLLIGGAAALSVGYQIYQAEKGQGQNPARQSAPPKEMQNAALSEDELTSCFIAGESAATVYLSDVVKNSSNGLMPSMVMAEACKRKGDETLNPKSCIEQCELGFHKVAKEAFN